MTEGDGNLEGLCKACNNVGTFEFKGIQKFPSESDKSVELYLCTNCGTTLAESSIIQRCKLWYWGSEHCSEYQCDGFAERFCYTSEIKEKL